MGWVGRAKTSVRNCQPTLHKIPKERTFHGDSVGNLKFFIQIKAVSEFMLNYCLQISKYLTFLFNKTKRLTDFPNLFLSRPGWNCSSILVVLESCHQTCMAYSNAECTVENS
jgi:hypothetical protein